MFSVRRLVSSLGLVRIACLIDTDKEVYLSLKTTDRRSIRKACELVECELARLSMTDGENTRAA